MGFYKPGTRVKVFGSHFFNGVGTVVKDTQWLIFPERGNMVLLDDHHWVWADETEMKETNEEE